VWLSIYILLVTANKKYIKGCYKMKNFKVYDYNEDTFLEGIIKDRQEINDNCELLHVDIGEGIQNNLAIICYDDETYFTTSDWQGSQPETIENIPDYEWVSQTGERTIVMNGLPYVFPV
jgi:hypothetical protein